MAYTIEFSRQSERQFKALTKQIQIRLKSRIDALANNPRPRGVKKLSDTETLYRIRVGDYRIIYQIQDNILLVLVVKIGDRREVYR